MIPFLPAPLISLPLLLTPPYFSPFFLLTADTLVCSLFLDLSACKMERKRLLRMPHATEFPILTVQSCSFLQSKLTRVLGPKLPR